MPSNTPDQQIPRPVDADTADNPVAFTNAVAVVEPRLVRTYTSEADRTARMLALSENNLSALADVDRVEVWNGASHVSLYTRSLFAMPRMSADQILTASSTVLQNVTGMSVAMPAAGSFGFRANLYYEATTVADIKFAFTFPAGVGMRWGGIGAAPGGAGTGDGSWTTAIASGTAIAFGGGGLGTVMRVQIEGDYVAGGTAGTLQLQAAQNTSEASVTTLKVLSKLEMWRML